MHLKSIEIENYKCFWESQKAELAEGFNLFIGANNSGKTTMLECLDLTLLNAPHRSINNLTEFGAQPNVSSQITVSFDTNIDEMRRLIGNQFYIPLAVDFASKLPSEISQEIEATQLLLSNRKLNLSLKSNGNSDSCIFESCLGKSISIVPSVNSQLYAMSLNYKDWSDSSPTGVISNYSQTSYILGAVREKYAHSVYRFSAQRRPASECGNVGDVKLDRDAGNLPYCINYLTSNDSHGHRILCDWIKRIFPSVSWIQAPSMPGNGPFQLRCLPLLPEARRDDLYVPLNQMGTGIGNVIAILYVVLTSRYPQVIAIDEPNSFLHPRALRELLQILSTEGRQHQFILTAHSADVITAIKPSLITLFELEGSSTKITQVDGKNISELRAGLSDLGIRMTDLHGRDRVLWVEGQTEEIVMPELLRHFCPEIAAGTAVLRVEHTGTFETKRKGMSPKEVAEIYKRLTASSALVPPMVAILLDREMRTEDECTKLQTESKGVLRFLDNTMLENYLLDPEAIVAILQELGEVTTLPQVEGELVRVTEELQSNSLDGAKVLSKIFSNLSGARHEFKKTRDASQLVSWLLLNKPEYLTPLGKFLRDIFGLPELNAAHIKPSQS